MVGIVSTFLRTAGRPLIAQKDVTLKTRTLIASKQHQGGSNQVQLAKVGMPCAKAYYSVGMAPSILCSTERQKANKEAKSNVSIPTARPSSFDYQKTDGQTAQIAVRPTDG